MLRFCYALDGSAILDALKKLVGLPQVTVEDSPAVVEALDLLERGMAFADALHLSSSREAAQFATFDDRLEKRADIEAPERYVLLA